MSLDFPLLVRSIIFIFIFSVSEGGKGPCFCCVFCPLSGGGNSGLHSTPSNYSSFCGIIRGYICQASQSGYRGSVIAEQDLS